MMKSKKSQASKDWGASSISPSQFMRELRPEYYSDTHDRVTYLLDGPTFEYHLDTITSRNQTHDFEVFCRKLCERAICPNLRPATGPEGGGDSKADTETFPVADEIAGLTYIGTPNAGKERWAFAFSANKKWSDKARNDVDGIVATGRNYDRIIFVTSRFAKAKDRARVEDELSKKHGLPVTIHDRTWIVAEVIEKDRKDLACNYLKIGEEKNDPLQLGPTDYSRLRQLTDLEKSLEDPSAYSAMKLQRVTEALLAAKLSRGLERPRSETDGRFARAIRFAEVDGTYMQKLETQYERIWTSYWWHDDIALLNSEYGAFETLALQANSAEELGFLCNLNQLLWNSVIHGLISRDECKLDSRTDALRTVLEVMASNRERPNNRLEARCMLLTIKLNSLILANDRAALPEIWKEYEQILNEADGLGEFDFHRLAKMIEIGGPIAQNDTNYTRLIEKLAKVMSTRVGEAEGALILLKRAQKLDFDDNLEMIRLLGRAAIALTKKEHNDSLVEALHLLSLAYRSAGLLWAARASCVFAASSIVVGAEDGLPPAIFVPTMKLWAWITLELRHIPDFLESIQLLNGSLQTLPLTDDSKERLKQDLTDFDAVFGAIIINLPRADLERLKTLPDILLGLGLYMSRTALLYAIGYEVLLREDGSIPSEETDENVKRMFSLLASQPAAEANSYPLGINEKTSHVLVAQIMGMSVEIEFTGTEMHTQVAEAVLGSIEAFFATTIEQRIMPHTERFQIKIVESEEEQPNFVVDPLRPISILYWPNSLSPSSFDASSIVSEALALVCGMVLAATCMMDNANGILEVLFKDGAVQQRLAMVKAALTSYHRLTGRDITRLEIWQQYSLMTYELKDPLPIIEHVDLIEKSENDDEQGETEKAVEKFDRPKINDHRSLNIRSVIDIHAWDRAKWRGTAFVIYPEPGPAIFALLFENKESAESIFGRWQERFGSVDVDNEIDVTIVRGLPGKPRSHYCVKISAKQPDVSSARTGQIIVMPSRLMTMEPSDSINLDRFLQRYAKNNQYLICPAILQSVDKPPEFLTNLAIQKTVLRVREAKDIGENDMDSAALRDGA